MHPAIASVETAIPLPVRTVFRGVGQVFFQENALTGACFVVGIALSSPRMAAGALAGATIGAITAHLLKYDEAETLAGIYGFNATLVGIATLFFFQPGALSLALLAVGCVVATFLTWLMRRHLPFPTYTTPFIVTTWGLFLLGTALGAARVQPPADGGSTPADSIDFLQAAFSGVGQVMFQGSILTGILFLVGIALSDWKHAAWVLAGSVIGMGVGAYHVTAAARAIDPEALLMRSRFENIELGLYGYNAPLAAVALFLWRRSLIPALLGALLTIPLTELVPMVGLPALTAPFVLATWIVLAFGWFDEHWLRPLAEPRLPEETPA
jgi:urea transporter